MAVIESVSSGDLLDWEWITQNRSNSWPRLACQQLADRAARSPLDEVMGCGDRVMDAEEFALRAGGLARRLLEEQSDRPVVVFVDRSLASAVALMAVHWAGRCLVPLDVDDLPSRSWSIIERVGECTVADSTGRGSRSVGSRPVIDLSDGPLENVDPVAVPGDSDALVVFTSGSTGAPKGIIRTGWQVDSAIVRSRNEFPEQYRSAVMAPLHWMGGFTAYRTVIGDGYQYIVDPASMPAPQLVAALRAQQIDVIQLTPTLVEHLSASLDGRPGVDTLTGVRLLGELVDWSCVRAARSLGGPKTAVIATYSATELAGAALCVTVDADVPLGSGSVPFGVPSPDHVTFDPFEDSDSELREIVVHRWVSKGYWGDPASTRRVFEVDDQGCPMYRTGDLAKVDADGRIWLTGRSDDVVKVSGKLLNPSESAAVLADCDGVRRAVVLPRALESGKKQLIGHVEADVDVDPGALRQRMAQRLPTELIPPVLVRHDELPLLPGGKVDRQHLLSQPLVPWRTTPAQPPRNAVEGIVAREAALLLGLDVVGVDDDLWMLGLDSLGAIELSEILARGLCPGATVNDFIGASTPAAIARRLAATRRSDRSYAVTLVEGDGDTPVFIVTGGGAPALNYRELAKRLDVGSSVVAFEQYGLMQRRRRRDRSVRASAARNIRHMKESDIAARPLLIGHSWGGLVAHEMAIMLRSEGLDPILVLLDAGRPGAGGSRADRPAGLLVRRRPWTVHALQLVYWRFHRVLAPIWQRRRPDRRHLSFLRHSVRVARRHQPGVFGGSTLYVQAADSAIAFGWQSEPRIEVVSVSGNHNSILYPPHVNAVAETISSFVGAARDEALQSGDRRDGLR